jgi:hypothetical protein
VELHPIGPRPPFQAGPTDAATEPERPDGPRVPRQRPFERLTEAKMAEQFADAEVVDDTRRPGFSTDPGGTRFDDRPAPSSAPPAWPPVGPPTAPAETAQPEMAEPLDMTAEIPRFRDLDLTSALRSERPEPTTGGPASRGLVDDGVGAESRRPVSGPTPQVMPFTDETMELPIFRALESAWFAASGTRDRSITGSRPPEMATAEAASRPTVANRAPWPEQRTAERHPADAHAEARAAGAPVGGRADYYYDSTTGGNQMAGSTTSTGRGADPDWHTNADEGWLAAAAAAEPADGGVTPGGLPRRVPLAQLVPGSVERAAAGSNRRSPDAVRGLLSAYHRGVQRGRQQTTDDTPESTNGRGTPGGKEQDT